MNFQSLHNTTGTGYSEEECTLKCVIHGDVASVNKVNEGLTCPGNHNGICRNGYCHEATVPSSVLKVFANYTLNQIEVNILSANFTPYSNWNYYGLYASFCLGEHGTDSLKCTQNHSTETINMMSHEVHWNQANFVLQGPFTQKTEVLIEIRYLDHRHPLAHLSESAYFMFDRHFSEYWKLFKKMPISYPVHEVFQMKLEGKIVADLEVYFVYKFSEKSSH